MTQSDGRVPADAQGAGAAPEPAGPPSGSRMARKVRRLLAVVIAAMLVWTALWFGGTRYGARTLDRLIADAEAEGNRIVCADRRIGGFPFQLDIRCSATGFENAAEGVSATLGASEAITLVYDPLHVIIGAAGPLKAVAPAVALDANWARMRTSLRVGTERLKRLSVVLEAPDIALRPAVAPAPVTLRAGHLELHLAAGAADDDTLEAAVRAGGLLVAAPGAPALPPADLVAAVSLPGALPRTSGPTLLEGWALAGRRLDIERLDVALGGFRVVATGAVALDEDGLATGTVTLRLAGLDRLPELAETIRPGSRDAVAQAAAGLAALTRRVEEDGATWQEAIVTIDRGVARAGLIPLGTIPAVAM